MSKVRKIKVPELLDQKGDVIEKDYDAIYKAAEEKRAVMDKENQADFEEQLKAFKKDNSYLKEYKDNILEVKDDCVLVRLFRFKKKPQNSETSGLWAMDPKSGEYVRKEELMDTIITNYAKVILSGTDKYDSGDVVVLPYNKVRGFYKNPEMEQYYHMMSKGGNAQAIPPRDKREIIPIFERTMGPFLFVRPWRLKEAEEDKATFLISKLDIEAKDQ